MAQSRQASFTEALTNVLVGLALALSTQMALYPAFGIRLGFWENLKIALSFTVLCGAPHNTVYAERMIMRSPWRLMTAKN